MNASFLDDQFIHFREIRRKFHQNPELSLRESWTAGFIAERLRDHGIATHANIGGNGVVGVIEGASPGPTVALRADMDALEIVETTGLPYASKNPGKMHACGHDGHMTILLAAGAELAQNRDFNGTVHLIFQPAEEMGGGAQSMIDDGLFARFPCQRMFGLHNWPDLPEGELAVHDGPVMAGACDFTVMFDTTGGHAGMPHLTGDPVLAGGYFVTGLQQAVARAVDPNQAAVATVAGFQGGSTFNVIPDQTKLTGTLRAFSDETIELLRLRLEAIAYSAGSQASCNVKVTYEDFMMPPVVNSRTERDIFRLAGAEVGFKFAQAPILPTMAGDDFGSFLKHVPGAYAWLGNGNSQGRNARLHQPGYDFNDAIIIPGARLLAKAARLSIAQQ